MSFWFGMINGSLLPSAVNKQLPEEPGHVLHSLPQAIPGMW
jgi:hypothetical protein